MNYRKFNTRINLIRLSETYLFILTIIGNYQAALLNMINLL